MNPAGCAFFLGEMHMLQKMKRNNIIEVLNNRKWKLI